MKLWRALIWMAFSFRVYFIILSNLLSSELHPYLDQIV